MKRLLVYLTAWVVCAACAAPGWSQEMRKPLAAWFGGYETITFNDEIVWPLRLVADVNYGSKPIYPVEPGALNRASAILVGEGSAAAFPKEEVDGLKEWVQNGGILILSGTEGQSLFGNTPPGWIGAKKWWTGSIDPKSAQLLKPEHPLAKGVTAEMLSGLVGAGGVDEVTTGVSVIGHGTESYLMVNAYGKGEVVVLGGKLTPQGWPADVQGQILQDLPAVAVQVWRNLAATLPLPTATEAIEQWAKGAGREFAVWSRWQKGKLTGGMAQVPPYPLAGDELKALVFNAGMGERCWKSFFVTNATSVRTLTVTPTDLAGPGGAKIPASDLSVYVQDKPRADYTKASYWLVDPQYVDPVGSPAVKAEANGTTTWWVKLRCVDARPGEYAGAIELKDGGRLLQKLPVKVTVWPLRQPEPDLLHYESEHIWFCMPGGNWTSANSKENNNAKIVNYMQHLGELGVDFGQSWSDVDRRYCLQDFVRLKEDGRRWKEAADQDPKILNREKLPHLDFSEYDTIYFDSAIRAGLLNFSMNYLAPENGDLTPEKLRAEQWYWREYATYLKDRGYTNVYTKIMDEFGAEGVKEFIKYSRVIRPAGIKTYTTTYDFMQLPRAAAKIDPDIDLWQMNTLSKPYREWLAEKNVTLDPKDIFWGCTASSFWGKVDGGSVGWLMAYMRFAGFHVHGYVRWRDNDTEGALDGPDGPFDSVTVVEDGQSVYQGRYLASLYRMMDYARKNGKGAAAAQAEKGLEEVIGRSPNALIPIVDDSKATAYGDDLTFLGVMRNLPPERFEAAKLKLFELTTQLKAALGNVPASVKYADTYLVKDGRPACRIVSTDMPEAAQSLAEQLKRLGGVAPVVVDALDPAAKETVVLVGTFKESEPLRQIIQETVPGEITEFYPGRGRYAIKYLPAYKHGMILIIGGNDVGVKKGTEMFGRFLTSENLW